MIDDHAAKIKWVSDYIRRRDAIHLMFAIHWYGRLLGRMIVA